MNSRYPRESKKRAQKILLSELPKVITGRVQQVIQRSDEDVTPKEQRDEEVTALTKHAEGNNYIIPCELSSIV